MSTSSTSQFDFTPRPGFEMAAPDTMGVFSDQTMLDNNPHMQEAMARIENDPRFSEEAIQQRIAARNERLKAGKQTPSAASVAQSAETVPDVISFGFDKIVFEFIDALHIRFTGPKGKAIAKLYELYWELVEHEPSMPYERFREVVYAIGKHLAQQAIDGGDKKMAKRLKKATAADAATTAGSDEKVRQLYGELTLELFEAREKERERLPKEDADVPAAANKRLYENYEVPMLAKVLEVHLFKLAKLDQVWSEKLDLQTRDRICIYLHRLCRVANLIDNFDPDMKQMINAVSLNSLNAVKGKNKGEIDINALLDELQERVLGNEEFLDKISEVAMKQAQ